MSSHDQRTETRPHRRSRKRRADGQRVVSIGTLYRGSSATTDGKVPYVRISGCWLEQFGFARGSRLLIAPEQGKLVLTIAPPEPAEEPVQIVSRRRSTARSNQPRRLPHLAVAFMRRRMGSLRRAAE